MILVTGGTGLLGSKLLEKLVNVGHKVRALKRNTSRLDKVLSIQDKVEWVEGDVLDIPSLEDAMKDITEVYHCAAMVSFNPSKRAAMYEINITGTANVVNVALASGVQALCHVSSIAALGRVKEGEEITEETKWGESKDNSHYSITKYKSEQEVWRANAEGLNTVIVNPSVILGEGNWRTDSSSFISNGYKGMPMYPPGCNGFVDSEDVVKAMIYLMSKKEYGEQFILSADNVYYKDLFAKIAKAFGKEGPKRKMTPFLGGLFWRAVAIMSFFTAKTPVITEETINTILKTYFYSNDKVKATGFEFQSIDETIKRCCNAYKAYLSNKT